MTYQPGDLLEDTRVEPVPDHPGRYRATISNAWNIMYVFGGVTMATALSAARAALAQPDFEPLIATGTFLSPLHAGSVMLDVRSLRRGKGAEQLAVELRADGSDGPALHLVSSFGPRRESEIRALDLSFPDVPPPESIPAHVPRPGASMLLLPYYHSIETRVPPAAEHAAEAVAGALYTEGASPRSRWAGWQRFRKTPRLADGSLDPLAYVLASDSIGPALRVLRGRGAPPVMMISLEISLHFFERTDSEWLLQDVQIYRAADGYVSGIVHLWDERKRLVGHALQRALLRPRAF
jgi:acyl-CoA thioesterase